MGEDRPDSPQDWRLPAQATPPTVAELVERIDEALVTARASEAAVVTVGAAALDAAEQARRAADLALRASAAMNVAAAEAEPPEVTPRSGDGDGNGEMGDFNARADRLAERLRRLQRVPLSA